MVVFWRSFLKLLCDLITLSNLLSLLVMLLRMATLLSNIVVFKVFDVLA